MPTRASRIIRAGLIQRKISESTIALMTRKHRYGRNMGSTSPEAQST